MQDWFDWLVGVDGHLAQDLYLIELLDHLHDVVLTTGLQRWEGVFRNAVGIEGYDLAYFVIVLRAAENVPDAVFEGARGLREDFADHATPPSLMRAMSLT
ncbi:hypothetical protein D3C75_768220 [compost metagenome]